MYYMMKKLKCEKCGHLWIPRQENLPKACPDCNSRKWKKNPKENQNIKLENQES